MLSYTSAKDVITCCGVSQVKIFANGSCQWYREYQLSVSHCPIDVTWFPFDYQVCDLIYESKTHDSGELNITRMIPAVELDSYRSDAEWKLLGKSSTLTTLPQTARNSSGDEIPERDIGTAPDGGVRLRRSP